MMNTVKIELAAADLAAEREKKCKGRMNVQQGIQSLKGSGPDHNLRSQRLSHILHIYGLNRSR